MEQSSVAQQVPLQPVPMEAAAKVADLRFSGRYVPAGPRGEPAAGDFFDVLQLDTDLVSLVIGDVAGHGPSALARMQQLRAAARAYAVERPGPASVVSRLDRLWARLEVESLATLWYGEYQPSTGMLTYVGAGHPPPVLARDGERSRFLEPASAPPLGTGAVAQHAFEHSTVLPPGALLLAYSDGLVERHGTDIEEQLVVLRDRVDELTAGCPGGVSDLARDVLDVFVPDPAGVEDDVCLLVVRREP